MIRPLVFVFVIVLTIGCTPDPGPAPRQTDVEPTTAIRPEVAAAIVVNGGFESWTGPLPEGWSVPWGALGTKVTVERAPNAAVGGHAIRLVSCNPGEPDRAWAAVLRQGPLRGLGGGRTCTVSFLARADRDGEILNALFYADPVKAGHWFRSTELRLGTAWRRCTASVTLPPDGLLRPVFLHFLITGGAVEIDEVAVSAEEPVAPTPKAGTPRRNLLDDPGFDVGGEAWTCTAWDNATDELPRLVEDSGQSGHRCLSLPGLGESLESRRYPVEAGRTYTVSLWARTPGPATGAGGLGFRLFLLNPDWKLAVLKVPASDLSTQWRRFSLSFQPPAATDPYAMALAVRLDPSVALQVDSFQLEAGEVATNYAAGDQLGLEVLAPQGLAQPGTLPLRLRARLEASRTCKARMSACDVRGNLLACETLSLGPVGPDGIELAWTPLLTRLGVVRLRAELVAEGSGAVLAAGEARTLITGTAATPANPMIGVDNQPLRLSGRRAAQVERLAAEVLGAGSTRVFFESVAGVRKTMAEDGPAYLALAKILLGPETQHRRPVTVCLDPDSASPLFLRNLRKAGAVPSDEQAAPAITAFALRAGRVAAGMGRTITTIELLNEPNIWDVNGAMGMPPARYARLVTEAAAAIRAAAPGMLVAANINGIDLPYVTAFLKAHGGDAIDLLTVHPYRTTPELPPIHDDLLRLRHIIDGFRPGLPMASTEQYYGSREDPFPNWNEYRRSYIADTEAEQAGRSAQSILHAVAAGVPYTLFGPERTLYRPTLAGVRWFFTAGMVRHLANALHGVDAGTPLAVHPACRAFLFARPDGVRIATIATREHAIRGSLALPEGCQAWDAEGNDLSGPTVPVDDLPLVLAFPPGPSAALIATRLHDSAWLGFDFPLALRLELENHTLVAQVVNQGLVPAGGSLAILDAPAGWPRPTIEIPSLPPGGRHRAVLGRLDELPRLGTCAGLRWRGSSGNEMATRWSRIPLLRIPRRTAAWPAGAWITLGEEAVTCDFSAGKRPHRGPADLAARVALAWDTAGLHMAVTVRDDRAAVPPTDPSSLWLHDSLQVYLDPADAAQGGRGGYNHGDAVWLFGPDTVGGTVSWLNRNPGNRYIGAENAETGLDPLVKARWQPATDGWSMTVSIPPEAMPGLRLAPGSRLGLSLLINDDDGDGRKPGLSLGPAGTEPYDNPWLWPGAELVD